MNAVTTADSANPTVVAVTPARVAPRWEAWLLPPATILVIVVGAVLLLMTPMWMHVALRASGGSDAFITQQQSLEVSDRTVAALLLGQGTFSELFTADEVSHLRDASLVLYVFLVPAAASLVLLVSSGLRRGSDPIMWRAVARGGSILVVGTVVLGTLAFVAFDVAFELFHRIFFPGGNWAFPPNSMLIRLYPYAFWELTSLALGLLLVAAGAGVWFLARRKAVRLEKRP
ncbi:MAG: DUF1461 domain-containing protein [Chloroflexota bacterium]